MLKENSIVISAWNEYMAKLLLCVDKVDPGDDVENICIVHYLVSLCKKEECVA